MDASKNIHDAQDVSSLHSVQVGQQEVVHLYESNVVMKKQFGTIATLGVAFAVLNSWVAESASMLGPISLGGCVTLIWGCVAGALFTTILCAGVAEMASAFPNAGGPYHYTYMLSSESYKNFLSFFVGWSAVIAWWFITSSAALFMATFILGMVILVHPDFAPEPWQVWLLYVAIIILHTVIVLGANSCMGTISSVSLYWSLGAFIVCLITSLAMHRSQPYRHAAFVFGDVSNTSGWSSDGLAFVIGWILSTYNFLGIDAATHLSEEMPQPEKDVPRAMAGAIIAGFITSFAFLTALLFCITDIDAIQTDPTGVPMLAIFYQATGSKPAAIVLCSLIAISVCFSLLVNIVVAGRTTWAFARDNGMPFSEFFSAVDERVKLPVRATLVSTTLSIVYGAIYIGSDTAFQSIVGSSIVMLFSTYAIPQAVVAVRGRSYMPTRPYDLGKVGWMCNSLAPMLAVFSIIILCFPVSLPVTAKSMNYLSPIVVGCWTLIVGFYVLHKKGRYSGPIVQEDS